MELTQEQLEELDQGKPAPPRAVFYEKAKVNVEKSKAAGYRVYDKLLYIKLSQPGVVDNMSYLAQQEDINQYPEEYEYFTRNKQGTRVPGIEIIPNLDIVHLQELRDSGILNIIQLAEAEIVPPHLEYARKAARMFQNVLKESNNEPTEEESTDQIHPQAQAVPTQDRREHGGDVRRPDAERSNRVRDIPRTTERHAPGGRSQRHQGVNWGAVRIA